MSAGPQKSKEQRKQERKARLDAERGSGGTDALLSGMQKPTAEDLEAVGAAKPSRVAQVCAPCQAIFAFLSLTWSKHITKGLGGCWGSSAAQVNFHSVFLHSMQQQTAPARLGVSLLGSALQHAEEIIIWQP